MNNISKQIRRDVLETSYRAGACHIGSALSCVEILAVLYYKVLEKEDIFLFSKASGVVTLYTILADKGFIPKNKIAYYLKKYPLPSKEIPGVVWSGGSLGQGLSVATGIALADRSKKVYCLLSDGELQEGNTWEAMLFAGHHKLQNLTVIIDRNGLQACGKTEEILGLENLHEKFKAFNWQVIETDGHDCKRLENILKQVPLISYKPTCVIAETIKGFPISFMKGEYSWHYLNLDKTLLNKALKELE